MTELEKFKRELLVRRYAQSSIETYMSCLSVIYYKVSKDFDIQKIKDYVITLKEQSYHKQMVSAIRNYYNFVKGIKLDFSEIPYPRKEEKIPEVFSVEEMKLLIEYPKNLKHQVIICYLYNCGLRVSELINLKLSDINRGRMIITVKSSKNNKDRIVPISEKLLHLTENYYRQYNPVKYLLNGQFCDQYTESSINQMLKYWAAKCGLRKHIHAHKLRHSFATHLHESGTDLNIIRDLLGHSVVSTTEIYTKTSTAKIRVKSLLTDIDI